MALPEEHRAARLVCEALEERRGLSPVSTSFVRDHCRPHGVSDVTVGRALKVLAAKLGSDAEQIVRGPLSGYGQGHHWKICSQAYDKDDPLSTPAPEGGVGGGVEKEIIDGILSRISSLESNSSQQANSAVEGILRRLNSAEERVKQLEAEREAERLTNTRIEVVIRNQEPVEIEGVMHCAFATVYQLMAAGQEVWLPGPSGCGKSYMVKMIADALNYAYAEIGCSEEMPVSQFIGKSSFRDGTMTHQDTEFLRMYEGRWGKNPRGEDYAGAVFLLDEMDRANDNVLTAFNNAIGNGRLAVPDREELPEGAYRVKGERDTSQVAYRHPKMYFVAATNTMGRGNDRMYPSAAKLCTSTRDRFRIGRVPMDYDPQMERALIAKNSEKYGQTPDFAYYDRMAGYRPKIKSEAIEQVISTRFLLSAYEMMHKVGWTELECDKAYFADWTDDELSRVGVVKYW